MPDVNGHDLRIPTWFIRLTAAAITLAVPWAVWVTIQLTTIGVRIEAVAEMRQQVDVLARRFGDHLSDPGIHHAAARDTDRRLQQLERQVQRLETTGK